MDEHPRQPQRLGGEPAHAGVGVDGFGDKSQALRPGLARRYGEGDAGEANLGLDESDTEMSFQPAGIRQFGEKNLPTGHSPVGWSINSHGTRNFFAT